MHPGNCLKRFVKREGFYVPTDVEEEDGSEGEEEEEVASNEDEEMNDSMLQPEVEERTLEIVLPGLTAEQ